ncbi:MAG: hypothetical protein E6Q97_18290 [Desulfurellales bacterium]|nr:MAG: hypothetical protein E6Q97_18290 [Desulfurellales bacterium]
MEFLIAFWLICGIVGGIIGNAKNAGPGGFALGVLLGSLGVLAAFALDGREKCRRCGTRLNTGAVICPMCQSGSKPRLATRKVSRQSDDVPDDWFDE